MLAYMAPVCQKTSEAPADRYSQCWQCVVFAYCSVIVGIYGLFVHFYSLYAIFVTNNWCWSFCVLSILSLRSFTFGVSSVKYLDKCSVAVHTVSENLQTMKHFCKNYADDIFV